jgi:ATP-dependent Lon protease
VSDSGLTEMLRSSLAELMGVLKPFFGPKLLIAMQKTIGGVEEKTLPDLVCSVIELKRDERLDMLSSFTLKERLEKSIKFTRRQVQVLRITTNARAIVSTRDEERKREMVLLKQLESIKRQLGRSADSEEEGDEFEKLARKIETSESLTNEAQRVATRELKRAKTMNPANAEFNVIMNYLSVIIDTPFKSRGTLMIFNIKA